SWGASSWRAVLEPVAPGRWHEEELTVNYRTPSEVMTLAAEVLHAIDPALEPPTSVRDSGHPPVAVRADADGLPAAAAKAAADAPGGEVSVLTVAAAEGLGFGQVVLVEPALLVAAGDNGLRDLYVAMTRPTQQLVVVHARDLPPVLGSL